MATLQVTCPKCASNFELDSQDDANLSALIDREVESADFDMGVMYRAPGDATDFVDVRLLGDLACAIRAGDKAEAERLLDLVAEQVGGSADHEVQLGRYRRNPLLAAAA